MKKISRMLLLLIVINNFLFAENLKEIDEKKIEIVNKEQNEEVNTGQDFTKPLTRFDIRGKYQSFDGNESNALTVFRMDKPVVLENEWKLAFRTDIPVGFSNRSNEDTFGSGDLLGQLIVIAPQGDKNWTWGYGAQTVFNTASEDNLGTGRNQLAPLLGIKADFKTERLKGFTYLLIRDHNDIGGDSDRKKQDYLIVQPAINFNFSKGRFITIAPEMKLEDGEWFVPFSILVGKMVTPKTVVSLEYKTPIYDKNKEYNNELEFRIGYFF
ncbi:hypothetical protein [Psychrilyobacter atlanticus]|uniref:hypothetical protein n=1 Tax=Psychrilyobacter atlanticus TaxID=271091 RepID=UPI0004127EAE|nr:hypothetical protein [Psychrilyobacter atlanticus]